MGSVIGSSSNVSSTIDCRSNEAGVLVATKGQRKVRKSNLTTRAAIEEVARLATITRNNDNIDMNPVITYGGVKRLAHSSLET